MLLRLVVKNLFSFKELTEFNTAPGRFSRLPHHVYKVAGAEVLKLNAVYGANGAGKSNMIRVIELLRGYLVKGTLPLDFFMGTFRFEPENRSKPVYIGVEFIKDDVPYYYGLSIEKSIIVEEELMISGLSVTEDRLLFRRTDSSDSASKKLSLTFSDNVMADKEAALFPEFLQNEILERNKPVLYYMKNRQNPVFDHFRKALEWFSVNLLVLTPESKPVGLAIQLESDPEFNRFAQDTIRTFNTGISRIDVVSISPEEFFGADDKAAAERLTAELLANPTVAKPFFTEHEDVIFRLQDGKAVGKGLTFRHVEDNEQSEFFVPEESDGTKRLIEYLPALYSAINVERVLIIDEIERSIHPLMIKELIRKFSHDPNTKGQLIFSTHESNLLDQDILRPDEIWFAEKNKEGATEFTTLSEFREHHTIDIRKGYLAGRYGGIPFLGNLKDLNWDKYAETDPV